MTNEKDSIIDALFDMSIAWAVYGLDAAKRGLETSARWMDARAKVMEELAKKLAAPAAPSAEAAPGTQRA